MNSSERAVLRAMVGMMTASAFGCAAPQRTAKGPQELAHEELCAQALARDDVEGATVQCTLCLEFGPHNGNCWTNLGLVSLSEGDLREAKRRFIRAVRYDQENAQAYNNLGALELEQEGDCATAQARFERALKVNPHYLEARFNLGAARYRCGKKAKAREAFLTLLAVNPSIADAHEYLGTIALEDGETDEAISRFGTAARLNPAQGRYSGNLGAAYERAGRHAEARDAYLACLDADPALTPCREALGRLH